MRALRSRPTALLIRLSLLLLLVSACADGGGGAGGDPLAGVATALDDLAAAEVERHAGSGAPANPLGLILEDCPVADADAVTAIGTALGIRDAAEGTVLNAVLQDPDGQRTVQCAIGYEGGSAGAVVLSVGPGTGRPDDVRAELGAADFTEAEVDAVDGLPEGSVLLFDADAFEASRAVYVGADLDVSLTANTDLAGTGALLEALPVAVTEVARTIR